MSRTIYVAFQIKDQANLEKTLKEMNISYKIDKNCIVADGTFRNIEFNLKTNNISFDEMDTNMVNQIKQNYMVNFYKSRAILEGMQVHQELHPDGKVVLHLIRL